MIRVTQKWYGIWRIGLAISNLCTQTQNHSFTNWGCATVQCKTLSLDRAFDTLNYTVHVHAHSITQYMYMHTHPSHPTPSSAHPSQGDWRGRDSWSDDGRAVWPRKNQLPILTHTWASLSLPLTLLSLCCTKLVWLRETSRLAWSQVQPLWQAQKAF